MPSAKSPLSAVLAAGYAGGMTLTGGLEEGTEVSDLELEDCRIDGGTMERTTWRRCTLDRVTMSGVSLSMGRLVDTRFAECVIRDSKAQAFAWTGLRVSGLADQGVSFERCRLDYGSFMGIDGRGLRFTGCSLVDADFGETDLREVEFVDCDLSGARFSDADLRGALFADVRGLSLDPREARTTGMRVDASAALDLVTALGIEIVAGPTAD